MVSGDLILCAAQSTLQLFSTELSKRIIVLEIWLHHGLVCVIIASHNIGQRACPASAQTSSVMMAPSSCSYMSTPLNLISHSFPRRGSLLFGDLNEQGKGTKHFDSRFFENVSNTSGCIICFYFSTYFFEFKVPSNIRLSMCCLLLIIAFSITLGSYCHNGRTRCFVMPPRFGPSNLHSLRDLWSDFVYYPLT